MVKLERKLHGECNFPCNYINNYITVWCNYVSTMENHTSMESDQMKFTWLVDNQFIPMYSFLNFLPLSSMPHLTVDKTWVQKLNSNEISYLSHLSSFCKPQISQLQWWWKLEQTIEHQQGASWWSRQRASLLKKRNTL